MGTRLWTAYFLLSLKRRQYPGLPFSRDYGNGLILNDGILRTSRDSLSVLNKVSGSLASGKYIMFLVTFLLLTFK